MKKIIFAIIASLAICVSASAQQQSVGAAFSFCEDEMGIGVRYNYAWNNIRLAPEGVIFFPDHGSLFHLNANVHYVFNIAPKFSLYPLAGLCVGIASYDGDSNSDFGLNIGGGAEYDFASQWAGFAEAKGILGDGSGSAFTFGVAYKF